VRLATIVQGGRPGVAVLRGDVLLPLPRDRGWDSIRAIAGGGPDLLRAIADWADTADAATAHPIDEAELGPAVPDPGAIYTIGHNYPDADGSDGLERPLVYGKAASSVSGHGATVSWDRALTDNVDAECELGVVIGADAWQVPAESATAHVFGYTIVNDISSRDAWLDGDQWLLGKSMPGFCPVGPWIVTADELDPRDLRIGCTIDGMPIQDGRTSQMRFKIPEIVAYLSRHARLAPGDLVATGTPPRLPGPPGPQRRLRAGDTVITSIEGIGDLEIHVE
jgi:2-keto-4-pentenoate hydratase/2-oxohepta-3-ene-1,7-dioic acid hydratase in catechol pathway